LRFSYTFISLARFETSDETGKLPLNVSEVQICAAPLGSPA